MNWESIVFFIVVLIVLSYFLIFWQNRHEKVHFHLFNKKITISLGLLTFGTFLDGTILAALLFWLLN